jgi:hypothetical protein
MSETITRQELADMLERAGYHTASGDVLDGRDIREATEYVSGIRYDDGEARWLSDYLDTLHGRDPACASDVTIYGAGSQ